jgi:glucokinase
MALGGLYITGGMAMRVPVLEHPAFFESFRDSPQMEHLLRDVPVLHIRSQRAGLWGAAAYGIMQTRGS